MSNSEIWKTSQSFFIDGSGDQSEIINKKGNLSFFIVSGYEPKFYFWETVVFLKKATIVLLTLLMNFLDKRSTTAFIVLLFFIFFSLNEKWKIYGSIRIKIFESLSLMVAITTIVLGLFSSLDDIDKNIKLISLGLVVSANLILFFLGVKNFFVIKFIKYKKKRQSRLSMKK